MFKNKKLILIIALTLLLAIALLINIKVIGVRDDENKTSDSSKTSEGKIVKETEKKLTEADIKNLKIEYEKEFSAVTEEYEKILNDSSQDENPERLNGLRERMLKLVIPEEYKKTHLELVLIFTDINNIVSAEKKDTGKAVVLLGQAKEKFSLLKNI